MQNGLLLRISGGELSWIQDSTHVRMTSFKLTEEEMLNIAFLWKISTSYNVLHHIVRGQEHTSIAMVELEA